MDLNQAEVAVTTQHLIDTRQEKRQPAANVRLRRHGGIPVYLLRTVSGRGNPGIQVHEMGGHSGLAHQQGMAVSQLF